MNVICERNSTCKGPVARGNKKTGELRKAFHVSGIETRWCWGGR